VFSPQWYSKVSWAATTEDCPGVFTFKSGPGGIKKILNGNGKFGFAISQTRATQLSLHLVQNVGLTSQSGTTIVLYTTSYTAHFRLAERIH